MTKMMLASVLLATTTSSVTYWAVYLGFFAGLIIGAIRVLRR